MQSMSWRYWANKVSELCQTKHGNRLYVIELQYDTGAAYDQGKSPEEVIKDLEEILESWTNRGLNIYGLKGGCSPSHPETQNKMIYVDWEKQLIDLVDSELLDGISLESFCSQTST